MGNELCVSECVLGFLFQGNTLVYISILIESVSPSDIEGAPQTSKYSSSMAASN